VGEHRKTFRVLPGNLNEGVIVDPRESCTDVALEMVGELGRQQRHDLDVDALPVHVRDALVGLEQARRDLLRSRTDLMEDTLAASLFEFWGMVGMRLCHPLESRGNYGMCMKVDGWHFAALPNGCYFPASLAQRDF
jgi:hypothetical protein